MKRREAIRGVGLAFGTLVALPNWAKNWNQNQFNNLVFDQQTMLSSLVECIIPENETPGAKSIGVHLFVERMLKDCYEESVRKNVAKGLEKLEAESQKKYNKTFSESSLTEREQLFSALGTSSVSEDKRFFSLLKRLTIQAYTNSEFFLKNYRDYEMAPGFFNGCVPV